MTVPPGRTRRSTPPPSASTRSRLSRPPSPEHPAADVYKAGRLAATLTRSPHGTTFSYLTEYLSSGLSAVATTLPLADTPVHTAAGAVPPFFAGLLPKDDD
jgi:HipA N-terminal domain